MLQGENLAKKINKTCESLLKVKEIVSEEKNLKILNEMNDIVNLYLIQIDGIKKFKDKHNK